MTKNQKNIIFQKLLTKRIILRPLTLADTNDYFEAEQASIKEMAPYWSWAVNKSVEDIREFIEFTLDCHKKTSPQNMFFALTTKNNNEFLGCVWMQAINWFVPKVEISYWLDTRKTGHGYMSEAINALTRAWFSLYDAKRVEIKTFVTNQKSRSIPERLGFKLEATLDNYFIDFVTNEILDGALYSCTNINKLPPLIIEIIP